MTQAPVRRRLDPAERRAQILETALQLFENQPFQSVSLRQIARACGVNIALLYHYFDSKEDLVRDSLLYAVESFTTAFDACEPPKDQPLGEASVWLFAAISSIPMLVRMVRLMSDYGLQSDSDPRAHRIVEDFYTRERTTFERAFQKGTTEGRFRPLDPARLARMTSMTMDGIFYSGRARADQDYAKNLTDLHDQLAELLLRPGPAGLCGPGA